MTSEEKAFVKYYTKVVKEGIEGHDNTLRECAYSSLISDEPTCCCEKCVYLDLYLSDEFQEAIKDATWGTCERYIDIGVT